MRYNLTDYPNGVVLRGPEHPDFDGLVAGLLPDGTRAADKARRALAVVLRNESRRPIVVYTLVWRLTDENGRVYTDRRGYSVIWTLMDGVVIDGRTPAHDLGEAIMPGGARLFSPVVDFDRADAVSVSAHFIHRASGGDREEGKAVIARAVHNDQYDAMREYALAHVPRYAEIGVSVAGAFFDDGLFVGTDETGLFEETQAQVRGKYDLLREIAAGAESGKPYAKIFNGAEEQAKLAWQYPHTPEEHYREYQRIFAQEIVNVRRHRGDEQAVRYALGKLARPWVTLRKA